MLTFGQSGQHLNVGYPVARTADDTLCVGDNFGDVGVFVLVVELVLGTGVCGVSKGDE
jgi:hypothetical protein